MAIGPDVKREGPSRCGSQLLSFSLPGDGGARIERERAVDVVLQRLVLCAERLAFERVRIEQAPN